jgi:hypothetical protein
MESSWIKLTRLKLHTDTLRAMPNLTTLDIGGLNSRQESGYDWEQDDQNPEFDWPKGRYHGRGQGDLLRVRQMLQ